MDVQMHWTKINQLVWMKQLGKYSINKAVTNIYTAVSDEGSGNIKGRTSGHKL